MIEYIVIEEVSAGYLTEKVNKLISTGWMPLGGVSMVVQRESRTYFAQALIKTKEAPDIPAV